MHSEETDLSNMISFFQRMDDNAQIWLYYFFWREFDHFTQQIKQMCDDNEFNDIDLNQLKEKLNQLGKYQTFIQRRSGKVNDLFAFDF